MLNTEFGREPELSIEDQKLVQQILANRTKITKWVKRYLGNHPHKEMVYEDLTQEVLLKTIKKLSSYKRDAALITWVHAITRNLVFDYRRRVKRELNKTIPLAAFHPWWWNENDTEDADRDDGELALQQNHSEDKLIAALDSNVVKQALFSITHELREAVWKRDACGESYGQIAADLNLPEGTVKSRVHRGRAEFKSAWESISGVPTAPESSSTAEPEPKKEVNTFEFEEVFHDEDFSELED